MHRVFQRDLCKLRLNTARAYVKLLHNNNGSNNTVATVKGGGGALGQLRINAGVKGMGPEFRIFVTLQNCGSRAMRDLYLVVECDSKIYKVNADFSKYVPVLVPNYQHVIPILVDCIDVEKQDAISVLVVSEKSVRPLVTAVVQMPLSEMSMLEE